MQTHIFHPLCLYLSNTKRLVLGRFGVNNGKSYKKYNEKNKKWK